MLLHLQSLGLQLLTIDPDETSAAPSWSPDGDALALLSDLGVVDYESLDDESRRDRRASRSTNTGAKQNGVDWSPDGSKLVLSQRRDVGCSSNCDAGLYLMNPDGSGLVTLVNTAVVRDQPGLAARGGCTATGLPPPAGRDSHERAAGARVRTMHRTHRHARCPARVRIVRLAGADLAAPDDRVAGRERRRREISRLGPVRREAGEQRDGGERG